MQEWIIAMLVISVLLIIRDMAKTILSGKEADSQEIMSASDGNPQKERAQRYARSFQKLADTFYGLPYRRDYLSSGQVERIIAATNEQVCQKCYQKEVCWGSHAGETLEQAKSVVRTLEGGDEEALLAAKNDWMGGCGRSGQYLNSVYTGFRGEMQELVWDNRLIENRLAIAQQLSEVSRIMSTMAEEMYDISPAEPKFRDELEKALKKRHVVLKQAWVMDKTEGRRQVFLTLRARSGQCVSVSEAAQFLSGVCKTAMTAAEGSRSIINGDFHTIHFVEDVSYQIIYDVARLTKEDEKVSGDNYICRREEEGRFVMCLCDGMGSGMEACRESELVVELLEEFLDSGLSQETAARMVNSALVLKGQNGEFSTVDLCAVDLYTGICSFLKAGACATFIRRDHWVEAISSESLAAGLVQQLDFEKASRKLYHGDYLIMMTDGVLDALPAGREEETMKEIIMDIPEEAPRDMGRGILERALGYSDYRARDDMTVLVAGLWKK